MSRVTRVRIAEIAAALLLTLSALVVFGWKAWATDSEVAVVTSHPTEQPTLVAQTLYSPPPRGVE